MRKFTNLSILCLLLLPLFSVVSCQKHLDPGAEPDKSVSPANYKFHVAPMESTGSSTKGGNVIAESSTDAMTIQLVENAPEAATKVVDEEMMENYWIFQFDGTEAASKMIVKCYAPDDNLILKAAAENTNRVVVLANTFDPNLAKSLAVGAATYQDVLNLKYQLAKSPNRSDGHPGLFRRDAYVAAGKELMMLQYDSIFPTAIKDGMMLDITLRRTAAKVTFKVILSDDMKAATTHWFASMRGVPTDVYYAPDKQIVNVNTLFPATVADTVCYKTHAIAPGTTEGDAAVSDYYIPVNHRGLAAEVKRSSQRRDYAPLNSTYLLIRGEMRPSGFAKALGVADYLSASETWEYVIHLGADFLTDYNIKPNYHYTYVVTMHKRNLSTDSRLTYDRIYGDNENYSGMLGGGVAGTGTPADPYRFTKRLILSEPTARGLVMPTDLGSLPVVQVGRQVTFDYKNLSLFKACYDLNTVPPASAAEMQWFLPSTQELAHATTAYFNLRTSRFPTNLNADYVLITATRGGTNHAVHLGGELIGLIAGYQTQASIPKMEVRCIKEVDVPAVKSPYKN